jgi:ribose 5-phosphate isomerase A
MTQDELKQQVGEAALAYVAPGSIIGVGTGSTVNHFIDALARQKTALKGAVSSSEQTTKRLLHHGIHIFSLDDVLGLSVYIDGADEIDPTGCMIKGGGAALTREKIVADVADRFICIADESKQVTTLGQFPVPVEIIFEARAQLIRQFEKIGGQAILRAGVITDNGGHLLDVHGLQITDPIELEATINQWPGVVTVGIFAKHRAHSCLLGTPHGVKKIVF